MISAITREKNLFKFIRQIWRMRTQRVKYDQVHKNIEFSLNDLVMVYWPIPKRGLTQKLLPKWDGPFKIIAKLGPVTYRVEKGNKVFAVHVQRLRKYEPWLDRQ